jgi:hypothetical protein
MKSKSKIEMAIKIVVLLLTCSLYFSYGHLESSTGYLKTEA